MHAGTNLKHISRSQTRGHSKISRHHSDAIKIRGRGKALPDLVHVGDRGNFTRRTSTVSTFRTACSTDTYFVNELLARASGISSTRLRHGMSKEYAVNACCQKQLPAARILCRLNIIQSHFGIGFGKPRRSAIGGGAAASLSCHVVIARNHRQTTRSVYQRFRPHFHQVCLQESSM